jgi:hypothetical protein
MKVSTEVIFTENLRTLHYRYLQAPYNSGDLLHTLI